MQENIHTNVEVQSDTQEVLGRDQMEISSEASLLSGSPFQPARYSGESVGCLDDAETHRQ